MSKSIGRIVSQWIIATAIACGIVMPAAADTLIFGGTRGVGLETARLIAAAGEAVTVMVRDTSDLTELNKIDGVDLAYGDALVPATIAAAFESGEFDAVVSTLSGNPKVGYAVDSVGSINAIDGAKAAGAQRFILVSSIGVGESANAIPPKVLEVLGAVLVEKAKAESYLTESGLDYTVIRPGTLLNKPANGLGMLTQDTSVTGIIRRVEVARLVVEAISDPATVGNVYTAVETK
jgi:uncharacterized protein YbjT (DUF2867 family)